MNDAESDKSCDAIDPESWLERYGDALYRFALSRVRDAHAAEDLVQDTLVSAVKSFDTFEGRSPIKTWLTSILRRRIADYYQRLGRRPIEQTPLGADNLSDDEFADRFADLYHPKLSTRLFQSSLEKEEFWQVIRDCVRLLPPHLQDAFVTRLANDDKRLEEICSEISVTANNFSVRLYRARLLLRQCFERCWLSEDDVS